MAGKRQDALAELFPVESKQQPRKTTHRRAQRNALNDLSPSDWLRLTKSVWYRQMRDLKLPQLDVVTRGLLASYGADTTEEVLGQLVDSVWLSQPGPRSTLKALHPATFAESDIERLITFFTKEGEWILDPFLGSGSSLVAAKNTGRNGVGVELIPQWARVARERIHLQQELFQENPLTLRVMEGDSRSALREFPAGFFAFVVTSPPYWSVLNKPADHKVRRERVAKGRPTRYSEHPADLANIRTYEVFLRELDRVWAECYRVLAANRYIAAVVSDFRDKKRFYLYHSDIADGLQRVGFELAGLTVLVQDSKTLYPYGMPHTFVSNIHHQFVVIARKPSLPELLAQLPRKGSRGR